MKVVAAVAQIDVYNKARGVTYVYESISYWDKDLKQPRSKRTLIGKRDEDGNIIPTGGRGRKKSAASDNGSTHSDTNDARIDQYVQLLSEKEAEILELKRRLAESEALTQYYESAIRHAGSALEKALLRKGGCQ